MVRFISTFLPFLLAFTVAVLGAPMADSNLDVIADPSSPTTGSPPTTTIISAISAIAPTNNANAPPVQAAEPVIEPTRPLRPSVPSNPDDLAARRRPRPRPRPRQLERFVSEADENAKRRRPRPRRQVEERGEMGRLGGGATNSQGDDVDGEAQRRRSRLRIE